MCLGLQVSPRASWCPLIIRKRPALVLRELNWVVGDLLWLWAGVQLHSSASSPTQQHYSLSMTNETDSGREWERYYPLCVCMCVCLRLTLSPFFLPLPHFVYFSYVCVCAHLLSWPPKKQDKTTVKTNRGKWPDNKSVQVFVHVSPHCLHKTRWTSVGKLPAESKKTPLLLLLPLSDWLCLYLFSLSCLLCLYFSVSIIVFINIYQCWSLLARIIVYFCGILYSVFQATGD